MTSRIDISSQALGLLRADTISSFSDGTNESDFCNLLYEGHIKHLLSIYPWTFATKKRQLSQDTTAPINEYTYSHIVPAETLLLWTLFNSSSVGAVPINDYDIYGTDSARRVFSNHSTLYADYTIYPDENVWPAYFTQFAIVSLASYLAVPVTGNSDLGKIYEQMAYGSLNSNRKGGLFGIAAATDSKQKRNEYIFSSPITEARFS
jgi:hypothetical protein